MTTNRITSICITITDDIQIQHENSYDYCDEFDIFHYLNETLDNLDDCLKQRSVVAAEACRVTLLWAVDLADSPDTWRLIEALTAAITTGMEGWRVDTLTLFNGTSPLQCLPTVGTVETPERFEPLDLEGLRGFADEMV